jgi:ferredoxin-type protein NapF
VDPSRRNILFGRRPQTPSTPRPPWASAAFFKLCTRCGDCGTACPSQIIKVGDGGYPRIDFSQGECTFCSECVNVCPTKALQQEGAPPWNIHAEIDQTCLAQQGVDCRICGEACDYQAIRFQLAIGKVAQPIVDSEQCSGCGACVAPCPSNSIRLMELIS